MKQKVEDLKAGVTVELTEKELPKFQKEVSRERELMSYELMYDGQGNVRVVNRNVRL